MIELVMSLLTIAVKQAVEVLNDPKHDIKESDRATLAKAAELAAELLERQKFGA